MTTTVTLARSTLDRLKNAKRSLRLSSMDEVVNELLDYRFGRVEGAGDSAASGSDASDS